MREPADRQTTLGVRRAMAACVAALVIWASPPRVARGEPDPLARPATQSRIATTGVMLAVGQAGRRLVAVGEQGRILLSDDNGVSWRQANVPVSVSLTNVTFPSPQKGWVVGHSGVILHTVDGGETWVKQLDGLRAAQLALGAARKDPNPTSPAAQKRLADAQQFERDGADKPFLDVYFEDERTGFAVGAYNLIFRTEDGGGAWVPWQEHVDNPEGLHLYGIRPSGEDLYLVGERGAFLRSSDRGNTFEPVRTPYRGTYFGLISDKKGGLIAFGLRGNAYRFERDGANWMQCKTGTTRSISAGKKLRDGSVVLVTAIGEVMVSRDGGLTFDTVRVPRPFPFSGLAEASDGSLILVGTRGVTRLSNLETVSIADGKKR